MHSERAHRSRIVWIASAIHPKRMIASPTVAALRALLSGRRSQVAALEAPAEPGFYGKSAQQALSVRLADLPGLGDVGGIAKLESDEGDTIGVARVGRTSFVGFKLDGEVLREIEVELDEPSGRLRIVPGVAYPGPAPS
jgi:hypothetical protein